MRRFAALSGISALALLAGCSGESQSASGGGAASSEGSGAGDAVSTGTSAGTGGAGGTWDPGGTVTSYHGKIGPIALEKGGENTQCITTRLANPDKVYARRFSTELGIGSHHMILYRSTETTENLTPTDCQGFGGLLSGDHPIFIAQQAHTELEMPTDEDTGNPVALEIDAHQMVRIELHFFNTTPDALMVGGDIQLDTVPLTTAVTTADIAFWGTQQFSIPPDGDYDTGVKFQRALGSTHAFAITTHQHHLGHEMRVWYGTGTDAANGTPLVDSFNWQDPPLVTFNPPISFSPAAAGEIVSPQGLAYDCNWHNTTPDTVTFGESINDEMCFLWQYYYPSQGFQGCLDGICDNRL